MTIEGVVYSRLHDNPYRQDRLRDTVRTFQQVKSQIEFNIVNCNKWSSKTYNGNTGWASVSRIMIAEVPPSQSN